MDEALAVAVEEATGSAVVASSRVHGGDVALAFCVDLADGQRVFAKTHRRPPPGFFGTEAAGLRWLAESATVHVPEVLAVSDGDPALLVLAWIDRGTARAGTDGELGRQLAGLHRRGAPCFGRTDRATTGSRALPNEPASSWAEFYAASRLLPLARLARDAAALPEASIAGLEALAGHLDRFGGADEAPARLHGDLWGGNRMVDVDGRSWLVDPAAHGGHREHDLAMMRLFGGFGPSCFASYAESYPLADGWEERVSLHQIAPLVIHAVKFGGGYGPAASEAIARYVR